MLFDLSSRDSIDPSLPEHLLHLLGLIPKHSRLYLAPQLVHQDDSEDLDEFLLFAHELLVGEVSDPNEQLPALEVNVEVVDFFEVANLFLS